MDFEERNFGLPFTRVTLKKSNFGGPIIQESGGWAIVWAALIREQFIVLVPILTNRKIFDLNLKRQ